ncbi:MAG: CRISPR-associated endonuclease Cas2 [Candidatus Taylorbacteria bacterium]|nr:CRISPR-associated endonuclease Cas2 [Candidatus Taylorbacteria bacterium]
MKRGSKIVKVLKAIGVAGVCLIVLGSNPRGADAVIRFLSQEAKKREYRYKRQEFNKLLWYLRKRKYVEILSEDESGISIKVTAKGVEKIKKFDFDNLKLKRPENWDRKWRIVIFDISDKRKNAREVFRNKLREMGFVMIQKSVWACPWDCIDEILFLRTFLNIESGVSIIIGEAIDEEFKLMRKFNLSTTQAIA